MYILMGIYSITPLLAECLSILSNYEGVRGKNAVYCIRQKKPIISFLLINLSTYLPNYTFIKFPFNHIDHYISSFFEFAYLSNNLSIYLNFKYISMIYKIITSYRKQHQKLVITYQQVKIITQKLYKIQEKKKC